MIRAIILVGLTTTMVGISSAKAVTFNYTGGAQTYQIANAGVYNVQAFGAQGGQSNGYAGGYGAGIGGHVTFALNTNLDILVGGHGGNGLSQSPSNGAARGGGGGGGGTFVFIGSDPVVMAGGGGGAGLRGSGTDAPFTQAGNTGGAGYSGYGQAGSNGSGGAPGADTTIRVAGARDCFIRVELGTAAVRAAILDHFTAVLQALTEAQAPRASTPGVSAAAAAAPAVRAAAAAAILEAAELPKVFPAVAAECSMPVLIKRPRKLPETMAW